MLHPPNQQATSTNSLLSLLPLNSIRSCSIVAIDNCSFNINFSSSSIRMSNKNSTLSYTLSLSIHKQMSYFHFLDTDCLKETQLTDTF